MTGDMLTPFEQKLLREGRDLAKAISHRELPAMMAAEKRFHEAYRAYVNALALYADFEAARNQAREEALKA